MNKWLNIRNSIIAILTAILTLLGVASCSFSFEGEKVKGEFQTVEKQEETETDVVVDDALAYEVGYHYVSAPKPSRPPEMPVIHIAFLSAVIGAATSFIGGERANSAAASRNRESIRADRENFQNRHQWEVEDLKKAGLNPVLSANSGASVPGANVAPVVNSIGESVNTALQLKRLDAEIKSINAAARKTNAEAKVTEAQGPVADLKKDVLESITNSVKNSGKSLNKNFGPGAYNDAWNSIFQYFKN